MFLRSGIDFFPEYRQNTVSKHIPAVFVFKVGRVGPVGHPAFAKICFDLLPRGIKKRPYYCDRNLSAFAVFSVFEVTAVCVAVFSVFEVSAVSFAVFSVFVIASVFAVIGRPVIVKVFRIPRCRSDRCYAFKT